MNWVKSRKVLQSCLKKPKQVGRWSLIDYLSSHATFRAVRPTAVNVMNTDSIGQRVYAHACALKRKKSLRSKS